jgi:hypothetical protein
VAADDQVVLAAVWDALRAATTRRTPFTVAHLATVDAGGAPHVRAVILRECDADAGTVAFAADARSPKVRDLRGDPRVALGLYDGEAVQLRLEGRAVVAGPVERRRRWEDLPPHNRRLYGAGPAPGEPLPAATDAAPPEVDRFAWVRVHVDRVDRLDLATDPHERTVLTRTSGGWTGGRVVP